MVLRSVKLGPPWETRTNGLSLREAIELVLSSILSLPLRAYRPKGRHSLDATAFQAEASQDQFPANAVSFSLARSINWSVDSSRPTLVVPCPLDRYNAERADWVMLPTLREQPRRVAMWDRLWDGRPRYSLFVAETRLVRQTPPPLSATVPYHPVRSNVDRMCPIIDMPPKLCTLGTANLLKFSAIHSHKERRAPWRTVRETGLASG